MDSLSYLAQKTKTNPVFPKVVRSEKDKSVQETVPLVRIQNLKVVYNQGKSNENEALRGVDLEIYPDEYVIFFGPSGCGKSTLINIIAGLEVPTAGEVTVRGRDLHNLSSNQMAVFHRKEIGMIAQAYNLIPTLNVLGNVVLPQIFERVSRKERKRRGGELLLKFGIEKLGKRLPAELSGGQQQRVGIARALVNDPLIILADEAVGNLDSESAQNVLEILRSLNEDDKKTIISVTHNPEHLFYADRIFHMKDGKIIKVEVNTEKKKKQSGKEADPSRKKTPLELLIEAYPDLSGNTVMTPYKAKILAEYLINRFEKWEVEILEKKLASRLLGQLDHFGLIEALDVSYEQGGLNLNLDMARHFSALVEDVFVLTNELRANRQKIEQASEQDSTELIEQMRQKLMAGYAGKLDVEKAKALCAGIRLRLMSQIGRKELESYLDRPLGAGGAGLNSKTAKKITQKLELILLLEFGT